MKRALSSAIDYLRRGKGAEVVVRTQRMGTRRLVLVPSPLFRDSCASYHLLIAFEGAGAMLYDGRRPLNKFMLVKEGFPIEAAEMAVMFIEQLFAHANQKVKVLKPASRVKGLKIWISK
jgi:hypothetical protein